MKFLPAATLAVSAYALKNQAKVANIVKSSSPLSTKLEDLNLVKRASIKTLPLNEVKQTDLKTLAVDPDYTYCELQGYMTEDCSGDVVVISGVAMNTCIQITGDGDDNYASEMYTAAYSGGNYAYFKTFYSDDSCTNEYQTVTGVFDSSCSTGSVFECFTTSNHDEDLAGGLQFNYYDVSSCGSDVVAYDWTATNTCLFGAEFSCDGSDGATFIFYENDDCSGDSHSYDFPLSSCVYQDENSYYDDGPYGVNTVNLYSDQICTGSAGGGGSDDDGCFSEFDTVNMKDGSTKLISQVQVGEEVLVMNAAGEYVYSNVVYVPHGKNNNAASFVSLTTESGRSVRGTVGHLMVANDCAKLSKDDLMTIDAIAVDQCVMTVDGAERVTDLKTYSGRGVYTVVTADTNGKIVVNGIAASSFSYNHAVVNAYYNIHRMLTVVVPQTVASSTFMVFNSLMGKVATTAV